MTKEEHIKRHKELHKSLDELFADFISHNPGEVMYSKFPIEKLLKWSYLQTINPDEDLKEDKS